MGKSGDSLKTYLLRIVGWTLAGVAHATPPECLRAFAELDEPSAKLASAPAPIPTVSITWQKQKYIIPEIFIESFDNFTRGSLPEAVKHEYLRIFSESFRQVAILDSRTLRERGLKADVLEALVRPKAKLAEKVSELIVVTHQLPKDQNAAAHLETINPKLKDLPLTVIFSRTNPLLSNDLLLRSQYRIYSEGGDFQAPATAHVFHLLGGYCQLCLGNTMEDIMLTHFQRNAVEPTKIFIYASQAYTTPREHSLAKTLRQGSELPKFDEIFDDTGVTFNDLEISAATATHGPHGPGFTYTVSSTVHKQRPPIEVTVLAK